jgi:predicted GIY-YIG superfamily endonuclease
MSALLPVLPAEFTSTARGTRRDLHGNSCTRLVWYEEHDRIVDAIQREKSLKRWYRQWKIELIESINPNWEDLYATLA